MAKRLILIVEDNPSAACTARLALEQAGYVCHLSPDGDTALEDFNVCNPSLVLLDLGLPGIPGFEVLERMKIIQPDIPVIIVTAVDDELSELIGLEKGADDYINKPIRPKALAARVRAVLRRSLRPRNDREGKEKGATVQLLRTGPIQLDVAGLTCLIDSTEVDLTASEFTLLRCLMEHPRWTHPRERLAQRIYPDDPPASLRAIDYLVSPLRTKLKPHLAGTNPILAKSGIGYRLNPTILSDDV